MRTVIVGGGTAGCVLAARLSQDPQRDVVLLEAGPGALYDVSKSGDYLSAVESAEVTWSGSSIRGRGIGGTSQINGMVAMLGLPSDYDQWAEMGAIGWSWADLYPASKRIALRVRTCQESEFSTLDAALVQAAGGAPLGGPVDATWDGTQRVSVADSYLNPAMARPNLTVHPYFEAANVITTNRVAQGVVSVDGTVVLGDEVILCAGAIGSAALLKASTVELHGGAAPMLHHESVARSFRLMQHHGGPLLTASMAHDSTRRDFQALPIARGNWGSLTVGDFGGGISGASAWLDDLVSHRAMAPVVAGISKPVPGGYTHIAGVLPLGSRLDDRCGVVGWHNLRVCDASIFPTLPRANPMMSVVLVAERLAELMVDT